MFGQIERGLNVEFRANPKADGADDEQTRALDTVRRLSRDLKFPEPAREPVLLESGDLMEDRSGCTVEKRTTRKTTTKRQTIETVPINDRST